MTAVLWAPADRHWCEVLHAEAVLWEQRVYAPEMTPDPGPQYRVRARRCASGMECNLAGYPCRWAGTNPDCDPLAHGPGGAKSRYLSENRAPGQTSSFIAA